MKALQIATLFLAARVVGEASGSSPESGNASSEPSAGTDSYPEESEADSSGSPTQANSIRSGDVSQETDVPYYEEPTSEGSVGPSGTPTPHDGEGSPVDLERQGYRNILYFTNWGIYGTDYQPEDIPADQITHLLYSFVDIAKNSSVISADTWADTGIVYGNPTNPTGNNANGCVGEIFRLKKENRKMKVLLSIGGYNWSPHFVPAAATPEGRQRFASSAVKLMADWGFDGLDIDWEYPEDEVQAGHYVLLLKACREALDSYAEEHELDYHFEITIATSAGPSKYNIMNLKDMDAYVDAWHLMSYDYAGPWDLTASGHQAALFADKENKAATKFNTEDAVAAYVAKGIQPHKIALGIPLYGRSFMGTQAIGGPFSGPGEGSMEKGIWLYRDLPRPGVEEIYDEDIVAAYSFDEETKEFVSYDNVESTEYKVEWLVGQGLGGVMFWEASGDKPCEGSLVETAANALPKLDDTPNLLHYPDSVYDNIRNGGDDCDEDYGPSTGSTGSSNSAFSPGSPVPSKRPASSGTSVSSKPSAPSGGSAPSKPPASSGSLASFESPGCSEFPESSGSPESAASTLPSST